VQARQKIFNWNILNKQQLCSSFHFGSFISDCHPEVLYRIRDTLVPPVPSFTGLLQCIPRLFLYYIWSTQSTSVIIYSFEMIPITPSLFLYSTWFIIISPLFCILPDSSLSALFSVFYMISIILRYVFKKIQAVPSPLSVFCMIYRSQPSLLYFTLSQKLSALLMYSI
jgi:hypothetical protein